jgi:hypothetical protein
MIISESVTVLIKNSFRPYSYFHYDAYFLVPHMHAHILPF